MANEQKTRRYSDRGALQDLLLRACPPVDGIKSIPILAGQLLCTSQTVYNWIETDRIPAIRAQQVVELSKGAVKLDEFLPFVFRGN